ncbi:UNKNOWN [Stylonychia lemnae]|uniref:Uncharacterized protein n=1 Tax=Stylonychia lemnae TaxID=5949 RepID=A0A078AJA9_STYLE|nr:UNKNOWN [Stylonychia lemnae]|eukprot:CDW82390.1 UNKNOWN [Stylonychia lemnae]
MQHHDTPTKTEAEKELHSLLNYKQSYFLFNDTEYVFPKLNLKNKTNIPIGPSEDYCIHLWWRQQNRDKTYDQPFLNVTELPKCENSKQQTKYKWGLNEFDHGVSFQAWRETQQKLWCANFSCEYDCSFHGGIYRNGTCYKYEILRRLCIKIDFDRDSKEDQIEFQGGCYESDEVGLYEQAKPNETYSLEYIPLEVRHKQDPYIVYAESHYNLGRDLSIFFWLSVGCLASSLFLTVLLSFCFCFIIKNSDRNNRKYVREDLN